MHEDPHEVLGLPQGADQQAVRQRYLELVRQFPPDRAAERFASIRAAYELLHDPVRRLQTSLFDIRCPDTLDGIVADLRRQCLDPRQIPLKTILRNAERA